jgi:hypothetical protein
MLSRPIALGLVAAACVAAAGGGAYIATLQNAREGQALAAPQQAPPAQAASAQGAAPSTAPPASARQPVGPVTAQPTAQPSPDDSPGVPENPPPRVAPPRAASQAAKGVRATGTASRPDEPRGDADKPADVPRGSQPDSQKPPMASPAQAPAPIPAPTELQPREEPRPEPQKVWEELTVPADSVIGLQLESSLNSETARVEDRVDARVTRDVRVNGRVAIPAGTHAIGSVILVERGGKIRDRARLGVRFNALVLADSTRASIGTDTVYREGDPPSERSSAKIGGAIIGAILGGGKGAAIGGGLGAAGGTAAAMAGDRHPVVLPVGTPLSVRMQAPVTLTVER